MEAVEAFVRFLEAAIVVGDPTAKHDRLAAYGLPGTGLVVTYKGKMFEFQVWHTNSGKIERGKKTIEKLNTIKRKKGLLPSGGHSKEDLE